MPGRLPAQPPRSGGSKPGTCAWCVRSVDYCPGKFLAHHHSRRQTDHERNSGRPRGKISGRPERGRDPCRRCRCLGVLVQRQKASNSRRLRRSEDSGVRSQWPAFYPSENRLLHRTSASIVVCAQRNPCPLTTFRPKISTAWRDFGTVSPKIVALACLVWYLK